MCLRGSGEKGRAAQLGQPFFIAPKEKLERCNPAPIHNNPKTAGGRLPPQPKGLNNRVLPA